jgi:WD40 repeat protein
LPGNPKRIKKTGIILLLNLEIIGKIADVSEACWQIGISPDGEYLALSPYSDPATLHLVDLQGKVFQRLTGHRGMIHSIGFARDGRTLVSGSADKTVRIWSPTGNLLALFDRFDQSVEAVSYAPEAPILAAGQIDGRILLFDLAGTYIATLQSPKSRIYCLDWSKDNNYLAAACADSNLYLFDISSQTKRFYRHSGPVYGVNFSNHNSKMVSSCEDGSIHFINYHEDAVKEINGKGKRVVGVAFSPDDRLVAASSFDKKINFYDYYGNFRGEFSLNSEALGAAFSADGTRLYISTKDRHMLIFRIEKDNPKS